MANLMPSLLFVGAQAGRAEEAMNLYVSLFPDSEITDVRRAPDGTILQARAKVAGRDVTLQDSAHPGHGFRQFFLSVAVNSGDSKDFSGIDID